MSEAKTSVYFLQQGIWDMPLESMPLAAGSLKATALADERIRGATDFTILNYRGGVTQTQMADDLVRKGVPDVLACSVFGWNFRTFGAIAETFKQLKPDGWVVFGGTHVANQGERIFRMFPEVDVVVNGEGEFVFADILRAYLDGNSRHDLGHITGITYRGADGVPVTTATRERINDLDVIPSAVLTGAIDLTDDQGRFRYDVALMETNRGCPYKCAFCYWGGAIGQRVRAFSRERLRQEVELYAKLQVHTICLCDANFGLLKADEDFIDDLIEIRAQYGYPRALESSWAKNKSKVFYSIVKKMTQAGLKSSFTLALQSLDENVLEKMNRKNMRVNEWDDLVGWLNQQGLECYAELIWGAPGETVESFMEGYDKLSKYVSRIAVYPMLLLPNTDYSDKKQEYGIISVRGDNDDFEYVIRHNTMSPEDNDRMQRFLFWSRVIADASVLRHSWAPLRELAGITQSQVLFSLDEWVVQTDEPGAGALRDLVAIGTATPGAAIDYLYRDPAAKRMLYRWWAEAVRPKVPAEFADFLDDVFRYDVLTQPVYHVESDPVPDGVQVVQVGSDEYYQRPAVPFNYDLAVLMAALRAGERPAITPKPILVDLYYRMGVSAFTTTTNSEEIVHFMGVPKDGLHVHEESSTSDGPYNQLLRDSNC
ncbi:KedN5 family methylcobalamin-dependent radical SAM C-methyltransferase [Asanoa iriomotensis]|uniref:Radical SAM superfamily enzyme YgiQ (UPF0313 family) n=1 Tax=Asanoa iriomotensis TaxID=234613 RepID=A0ABQ4C0X4_9ACTN|nr:KedN5 family methylcobalamin-dependent radical SAM C-methyltransferase [Asanoa iriomotensis]GIF56412.1 hypothetical protein Air01nite_25070 [Asanoa iriomotensis]